MSSILSTALQGLKSAVTSATQSAGNIVNASSTGNNLDSNLINLQVAKVNFDANAKVVQIDQKLNKALLDIKV